MKRRQQYPYFTVMEEKAMKRFLALALALIMTLSLAACGGSKAPDSNGGDAASAPVSDDTAAPAPSGEVTHIKLEMATLMTVPSTEATKTVENVINDYLKNTLGETEYVLDLSIIPIADLFTTVPMERAPIWSCCSTTCPPSWTRASSSPWIPTWTTSSSPPPT